MRRRRGRIITESRSPDPDFQTSGCPCGLHSESAVPAFPKDPLTTVRAMTGKTESGKLRRGLPWGCFLSRIPRHCEGCRVILHVRVAGRFRGKEFTRFRFEPFCRPISPCEIAPRIHPNSCGRFPRAISPCENRSRIHLISCRAISQGDFDL